MRTIIDSVNTYTSTSSPQAHSPSVPISVFRDLAAELQATYATINVLTTENQQLSAENQLLRQEINKVIQSTLHLQNLVDSFASTRYNQIPHSSPYIRNQTNSPVSEADPDEHIPPSTSFVPPSPVIEFSNSTPEPIFIEEEEVEYYTSTEAEGATVSSLWFILAILLIILMGFGTGYLIVRPLFQHHNH